MPLTDTGIRQANPARSKTLQALDCFLSRRMVNPCGSRTVDLSLQKVSALGFV